MVKLRRDRRRSSLPVPPSAETGSSAQTDQGQSSAGERLLSAADQAYLWDIPRWNTFEEIWPTSKWMYDKFRFGGQPALLLASYLMLERATLLPPESMEWAARIEIEICQAERVNSLYEETGLMRYLLRALCFSSMFMDDLMAASDSDDDRAIGLDIKATTKKINYQQHDNVQDLTDALDYARQALGFSPTTRNDTACRVRFTMATLLRLRSSHFHSNGEAGVARHDISQAVELLAELNNAARSGDETGLEPAETASALAEALLIRYRQDSPNANKADLENSMNWWRESLTLTPEGHRALPFRLSCLGLATLEMAKCPRPGECPRELLDQAEHLQEKAYVQVYPFSTHYYDVLQHLLQTKLERFRLCAGIDERHAALDGAIHYAEELFVARRQSRGEMLMQDIRWMESSITLFRLLHLATLARPQDEQIRRRIDELKEEMRDIVPLEKFLAEDSEKSHRDQLRKIALCNKEKLGHSSGTGELTDPILPPRSGKASLELLFIDPLQRASSPPMAPPPPSSRPKSLKDGIHGIHRSLSRRFKRARSFSEKTVNLRLESHRFEEEVRQAEKAKADLPLEWVTLAALDGFAAALHEEEDDGDDDVCIRGAELSMREYCLRYAITAWTRRFTLTNTWTTATATQLLEDIIARSQCRNQDLGRVYHALAYVFAYKYGTTKSPLLADLAVNTGEQAVSNLGQSPATQLAATLRLAAMYYLRGSRFCTQADLDRGIFLARRVAANAACTRRETPRLWAQTMTLLAALYSARFEVMGTAEDLERAIRLLGENAIFLTKGDQGWPEVLVELARHVRSGAELHGEAPEAMAAVELLRAALNEPTIDGSVERAAMSTLAILLKEFSYFYNDPSPEERALFLHRKIVSSTSRLDPLWPSFAQDLAQQLWQRSAADPLANAAEVNEAVYLLREAIQRTPEDHSLRCPLSMNLVQVLMTRPAPDMRNVLSAADDALRTCYGPVDCVDAAHLCAEVYYRDGKPEQAYRCLLQAIQALQSISPQWLSLSDRQRILKDMRGVQSDAACLGLALHKPPAEIVELLEKSRTLILSSLLDFQADMSELERFDVQLFKQLQEAQRTLTCKPAHQDTWERLTNVPLDSSSETWARQEAWQKLNRLLQRIRRLEGFGSFLQSPPVNQLLRLAVCGPIVLVIHSRLVQASFAIILTSSGIQTLELPKLKSADIAMHASTLRDVCSGNDVRNSYARGQKLHKILRWLWKTTVRPVLDLIAPESAVNKTDVASLPHVCWIPVGVLSRFPLHAALGPGNDKNRPCTMDRVVSSYSASLRSLLFARSQPPPVLGMRHSRFQAITVEQTIPESRDGIRFPRLEGVTKEGFELSSMFNRAAPQLDRPDAATVLGAIRNCDILHFACHGEANQTDPSASSLILVRHGHPGDPPGFTQRVDHLTVADIFADGQRGGSGGAIAFLRACSTADNAAVDLPDEVIHLASAFQLAGFSHVLGTMWSTRNDACAAVTRRFYPKLLPTVAANDNGHRRIAEAFHAAVVDWMRTGDTWRNPLLWASFVHYGA